MAQHPPSSVGARLRNSIRLVSSRLVSSWDDRWNFSNQRARSATCVVAPQCSQTCWQTLLENFAWSTSKGMYRIERIGDDNNNSPIMLSEAAQRPIDETNARLRTRINNRLLVLLMFGARGRPAHDGLLKEKKEKEEKRKEEKGREEKMRVFSLLSRQNLPSYISRERERERERERAGAKLNERREKARRSGARIRIKAVVSGAPRASPLTSK